MSSLYPNMDHNFDSRLISLVQKHEYLYSKKHDKFKNKEYTDYAWKVIAKTMGTSAQLVEQRWCTLRQRFSRERKKSFNKTSDDESSMPWALYDQCKFLDSVIKPRKTFKDYAIEKSACVPMEEEVISVQHLSYNKDDPLLLQISKTSPPESPTRENSPQLSPESKHSTTQSNCMQHPLSESNDFTSEMANACSSSSSAWKGESTNQNDTSIIQDIMTHVKEAFNKIEMKSSNFTDADYAFGTSVALSIKEVRSPAQKAVLKAKIMNTIAEFMISFESNTK